MGTPFFLFGKGGEILGAYLHLFYESYRDKNGIDPISYINSKKEEIRQAAIPKLKTARNESAAIEREFQQLYNIKENEFADIVVKEKMQAMNSIMNDFDSAIALLKQLVQDNGSVSEAVGAGNRVIEAIDKILIKGASTGGLGDSAYSELVSARQRMQKVNYELKYIDNHNLDFSNRDGLKKFISDIQSNVSGYMLELSQVYAFTGANYAGLKNVYDIMINIGGHGSGLRTHMKVDPKMKSALQTLKQGLTANQSVQSHADIVFHMSMDETGNGQVVATSNWVGFQNKNVSDISSVGLRSYSLGEIGILRHYSSDFLVNIAGTLAGKTYKKSGIPKTLNASKNPSSQKEVDLYWANIKASTKILGLVNAIGQKSGANITNRVNYYVVRSKNPGFGGQIRVIPVSAILEEVLKRYKEGNEDKMGVNDSTNRGSSREKYWEINTSEFSFEKTPEERSADAYAQVLNKVLETKIQISINFSSWF